MYKSTGLTGIFMLAAWAGLIFGGCNVQKEDAAYVIRRVGTEIKVDGNVNKEQWQLAKAIKIKTNTFGEKKKYQSPTVVKAVYNDEGLFLLFVSQDKHIVARHTELNSDVSEDDCVEFFAVPRLSKNNDYFNLEINCAGTVLMHFGPEMGSWKESEARKKISEKQAGRLEIYHSVAGPAKEPEPDDKEWIIECKIPFVNFRTFDNALSGWS